MGSCGAGFVQRWNHVHPLVEGVVVREVARAVARGALWPLVVLALLLMAGPLGVLILAGGLGSIGLWLARRPAVGGPR